MIENFVHFVLNHCEFKYSQRPTIINQKIFLHFYTMYKCHVIEIRPADILLQYGNSYKCLRMMITGFIYFFDECLKKILILKKYAHK